MTYFVRFHENTETFYKCHNNFSKTYSAGVIDTYTLEEAEDIARDLRSVHRSVEVVAKEGGAIVSHFEPLRLG